MNCVALIGNVATEPELKKTPSGRSVCSFRFAVSRPGGDQADFFTVVTWERQAEVVAQYAGIGRRIAVEGRLHHSTWQVEGQRHSRVEIVASRVQLLSARRATVEPVDEAQDVATSVASVSHDSGVPDEALNPVA